MKAIVFVIFLIVFVEVQAQVTRPRQSVSSSQQSATPPQIKSENCLTAYDVDGYIIKVSNNCDAVVNYDLSFETEGKNMNNEVVFNETSEMTDLSINPLKKDSEIITVPQDPNKNIVYHFKNVRITRTSIKN